MSAKYCASLGLKSLYDGRSNILRVQVANKWKELNFTKPGKVHSIDMILNDEEGDELHATIPEYLIWKFDNTIKEGCQYSIEGLHLGKSKSKFRPARGEKRGLFSGDTRITELDTNSTIIIPRKFNFTKFEEINSNIENIYLTDVIGYLRAYTSIRRFQSARGSNNLMREITLENLRGSTIKVALWGNSCKEVGNIPNCMTNRVNPILLGICSTYVKNYKGEMKLSSTNATKIYHNLEAKHGIQMHKRTSNIHETRQTRSVETTNDQGPIWSNTSTKPNSYKKLGLTRSRLMKFQKHAVKHMEIGFFRYMGRKAAEIIMHAFF